MTRHCVKGFLSHFRANMVEKAILNTVIAVV